MKILRQKEYSKKKNKGTSIAYSQGHTPTSNDYFKLNGKGVIRDSRDRDIGNRFSLITSPQKKYGKIIGRTELGGLKGEFHYDGLRDEANRIGFISVASDKDRSYKDFYKDLLEAERDIGKVHESNRNNSDLSKSRKKLKNSLGESTKVTNKDIKDEIRKLAKKEKLKRVAKKAALIGVPVAAAAVGTGVAIKKHKNKKKKEQE